MEEILLDTAVIQLYKEYTGQTLPQNSLSSPIYLALRDTTVQHIHEQHVDLMNLAFQSHADQIQTLCNLWKASQE